MVIIHIITFTACIMPFTGNLILRENLSEITLKAEFSTSVNATITKQFTTRTTTKLILGYKSPKNMPQAGERIDIAKAKNILLNNLYLVIKESQPLAIKFFLASSHSVAA